MTRRQLLAGAVAGAGAAALGPTSLAATVRHPECPHFAPRAKRLIYLFQNGAPTHVDLFDYKPELAAAHGQPVPEESIAGKRFSTMTGDASGKLLLAPVEPFHRHGESGAWVSELMPHVARVADKLCFIKSMHTGAVNHAPGVSFILSGAEMPGRPTLGAWLAHGLGSENADLPPFVVMTSVSKGTTCGQIFYDFYWAGRLFALAFSRRQVSRGGRSRCCTCPSRQGREPRRSAAAFSTIMAKLNQKQYAKPLWRPRDRRPGSAQYEMAYRMQASRSPS